MAVSRPGGLAQESGRPQSAARSVALASRWLPQRPRRTVCGRFAPRVVTLARQQARFVRIEFAGNGALSLGRPIRSLSVIDSSRPAVDLALRQPVDASRAEGCGAVVDGNPCTRWSPTPRDTCSWISVDLGGPQWFDQICLVSDLDTRDVRLRIRVSADNAHWSEPETADDPFPALRVDLGAALPPCPGGPCEPLHTQLDLETWQVYAVNHTAHRLTAASITVRIYEPFGGQVSHCEQRELVIEPLSTAPALSAPRPAGLPPTHLLSLELRDADGALLSEHNRWRYQPVSAVRSARIAW
jgi:hypothetical protein